MKHRTGAVTDRAGHVTRAPEQRVEADEGKADPDDAEREEPERACVESCLAQAQQEHPVGREQHEQAATVCAEPAAARGDERHRREGDPGSP